MQHKIGFNDLSRTSSQRKALLRGLATSLLKYEVIETTEAKAKEARRLVEKIITRAKNANKTVEELTKKGTPEATLEAHGVNVHAHRMIARYLYSEEVVAKVFNEIAPRYANRNGGYTRILKNGYRNGDSASMVQLSLVDHPEIKFEKKDKKDKKKAENKASKVKSETKKAPKSDAKVKKAKAAPVATKSAPRKAMNSNKSV